MIGWTSDGRCTGSRLLKNPPLEGGGGLGASTGFFVRGVITPLEVILVLPAVGTAYKVADGGGEA
jgi:hypothetical protein